MKTFPNPSAIMRYLASTVKIIRLCEELEKARIEAY
jgi:hypothetical protein